MEKNSFVSDGLHKIKDRIATTAPNEDGEKASAPSPSPQSASRSEAKYSSQQLTKALKDRRDEFRKSQRDVITRLTGFLARVPEDERQCEEQLRKLRDSKASLEKLLEEVNQLDDANWSDDDVSSELGKAMRVVENARLECIRSAAKLEPTKSSEIRETTGTLTATRPPDWTTLGFGEWLKIGFAVSFPLIITIAAAAAVIALVIIATMSV